MALFRGALAGLLVDFWERGVVRNRQGDRESETNSELFQKHWIYR